MVSSQLHQREAVTESGLGTFKYQDELNLVWHSGEEPSRSRLHAISKGHVTVEESLHVSAMGMQAVLRRPAPLNVSRTSPLDLLALFWVGPHAKNERPLNPKLGQYGHRRWRCPEFLACIAMLVWGFRCFQRNLAYCTLVHSTPVIIPTYFQLGGRKMCLRRLHECLNLSLSSSEVSDLAPPRYGYQLESVGELVVKYRYSALRR